MMEQDLKPVNLTPKFMLFTEKRIFSPPGKFRVLTYVNSTSSGPRGSGQRKECHMCLNNPTCCFCYTRAPGYFVNHGEFPIQFSTDAIVGLSPMLLYPHFIQDTL